MVNDITIIAGIITVFITIGIFLPYITSEFQSTQTTIDVDGFSEDFAQDVNNANDITMFTVMLSVTKMFFWTFGALPFWLDAIFLIFRMLLLLIIARNVWVGGGG